MTKFKQILNETTGKFEFQFGAELVSINTNSPQKYTNAAGEEKTYYLGSVNFTYPNGVEAKSVTTSIYEKSYGHGMKIGDVLLSTLSRNDKGEMYIRTSHLIASNGVETANFEGLSFDALVEGPVVAEIAEIP